MATKVGKRIVDELSEKSFASAEARTAVANRLLERMGVEHSKRVGYELGTLTDAVNEQLQRAETALRSLGFGCSGGVRIDDDPAPLITEWLVFDRWEREWRLLLVDRECNVAIDEFGNSMGGNLSVVPLLETSRQGRLAAAAKLPDLLAVLTKRAEKELAAVTAAVEGIEAFNDAMEQVQ